MPRYVIDPVTGQKTKVSGTNYIPPCLAKTAQRKAEQQVEAKPVEEPEDRNSNPEV